MNAILQQYDNHLQRFVGSKMPSSPYTQDIIQLARYAISKKASEDPSFLEDNTESYVVSYGWYSTANHRKSLRRWDAQNQEQPEFFWTAKSQSQDPRANRDLERVEIQIDLQMCWDRITEHMTPEQAQTAQQVLALWSHGHPLRKIAQMVNLPFARVQQIYIDTIQQFREHWPDPEVVMPDEVQWQQTTRKRNKHIAPDHRMGRYEIKLQLPQQDLLEHIVYVKTDVEKFLCKHTGVTRRAARTVIQARDDTEWHSTDPKFQLRVKYIK